MDPFREASRASYQRLGEIKQNGSETEIHRAQIIADSGNTVELNATLEYTKSHPGSFVGASLLKSAAYYLTWQELEEAVKSLDTAVAATDSLSS
ncbi:MAG TPA: hypothetical protein DCY35_02000 [Prolixibacteraceae bacterium]|nr:hypothetical protein [Prolixibacteraceae bacterium]